MSLARTLLLRASRSRWLAEQFTRRAFARRAARRFLPGEELADALSAARQLATERVGVIITRLGESLTDPSQVALVRDHYLDALDIVKRAQLPVVISIKPTQFGLDYSFDSCLADLKILAAKAVETKSQLWIDMEGSAYTDRTLELYIQLRAEYLPVGISVQSYLRRTPADIERLLPLQPMVRLVKGAYAESPEIAYPSKADVDKQFVAIAERLMDAATRGTTLPVLGTHDMTIVQHLITHAQQLGLTKSQYEIHTLYGIKMAEVKRLAAEGHVVRCMINYGSQWFPWYMRRLAERPANVWFVIRSMFAG